MTFIATTTFTYPAGVSRYKDSSPDSHTSLKTWVESQPGFISATSNNPDENTRVVVTTFDTGENYGNMSTARKSRSDYQAALAYYNANNVKITFSATRDGVPLEQTEWKYTGP
jgi:hypothetical protein